MNKVFLTGRIANDLELRTTTTGRNVCEFRLAVNRAFTSDGERKADFISCRVWNKTAENLTKYQMKGNLIAVTGRLQVDSYTDKDSNKRYTTYITVEDLEYLESKKKEDVYTEYGKNVEEDIIGEDDYLPF